MIGRALERWATAAALLLLAGCAAAPAEEAPVRRQDRAGGAFEREAAPADADEPSEAPLSETPWSERPGGVEDAPLTTTRLPAFAEPERWPALEPEAPAREEPASLALAFVRTGDLVLEPEVVLDLDEHLAERATRLTVAALALPEAERLGPAELARLGRSQRRDLLLLELRPGREGEPAEALLFACADGRLLAAFSLQPPAAPTSGRPPREGSALAPIAAAWRRVRAALRE